MSCKNRRADAALAAPVTGEVRVARHTKDCWHSKGSAWQVGKQTAGASFSQAAPHHPQNPDCLRPSLQAPCSCPGSTADGYSAADAAASPTLRGKSLLAAASQLRASYPTTFDALSAATRATLDDPFAAQAWMCHLLAAHGEPLSLLAPGGVTALVATDAGLLSFIGELQVGQSWRAGVEWTTAARELAPSSAAHSMGATQPDPSHLAPATLQRWPSTLPTACSRQGGTARRWPPLSPACSWCAACALVAAPGGAPSCPPSAPCSAW